MKSTERLPSEYLAKLIRTQRICATFVGADFADPNYRINWVTAIIVVTIFSYFFLNILTVIKLNSWLFLLEAFCMSGSAITGASKLIIGMIYRKQLAKMNKLIENIYKEYEKKGEKYYAALHESCEQIRKFFIIVGLSFVLPCGIIVVVPFILQSIHGRRFLIMHFHIPGIDVETDFGYYLTNFSHCLCMYVGAFGLYAGDMIMILFLSQPFLYVDILKLKIFEFNEKVGDAKVMSSMSSNLSLNDIVLWNQFYANYTKSCNTIFQSAVTIQVFTSALSILLTLFIVFTSSWHGAYPYLLITVTHLNIYCFMGTKIEIANENFTAEIYNILWYKLTTTQQKVVLLMLMQSQNPNTILVAGVMPLSVSTGLQITKAVYSFLMVMLQSMNKK
ncbi:odorant receptor 67d-like [Teleopsis dalmanni]|uniref:odorant receptor 67d-like n=1 Tax=Teleopsis dalmanni TaxID=139649 RepID=UPI0018CF535D|nr:odorant receptor 67d-like [Teleopsis dalmanni]